MLKRWTKKKREKWNEKKAVAWIKLRENRNDPQRWKHERM